jgi:hypothetical protein
LRFAPRLGAVRDPAFSLFAGACGIALREHLKGFGKTIRALSSDFSSSLIRLQRAGLVGLRCNAGVVRQRLVVADHQAPNDLVLQRTRSDRQSPTGADPAGNAS